MQDLHINVLTRTDLANPQIAADLVRVVVAAHSDLVPRRYGGYEPLPHKVDGPFEVHEFLREWRSPVFWSNGRRATGGYWFDGPQLHSAVKASVTSSRMAPDLTTHLVTNLALQLDADLSTVYFAYESRDLYLFRYKAVYPFYLGPTTHDLKRSLPDLPWFTVFGAPYVDLFGREKLASIPAFRSEPLSTNHWIVQLTADPTSAKKDPGSYDRARDIAKEHLGLEHFLDLARPEAHGRTPDFAWARTVHNPLEAFLTANDLLARDPPPNCCVSGRSSDPGD